MIWAAEPLGTDSGDFSDQNECRVSTNGELDMVSRADADAVEPNTSAGVRREDASLQPANRDVWMGNM